MHDNREAKYEEGELYDVNHKPWITLDMRVAKCINGKLYVPDRRRKSKMRELEPSWYVLEELS
jgi:hypothetical protein